MFLEGELQGSSGIQELITGFRACLSQAVTGHITAACDVLCLLSSFTITQDWMPLLSLVLLGEKKVCAFPVKIMKRVIFPSGFLSVPLKQRHWDDSSRKHTPLLISILSIHSKSPFLFLWELGEISLVFENEASFSFPHESTQPDLLATLGKKCYKTFRHGIMASDGCFPCQQHYLRPLPEPQVCTISCFQSDL